MPFKHVNQCVDADHCRMVCVSAINEPLSCRSVAKQRGCADLLIFEMVMPTVVLTNITDLLKKTVTQLLVLLVTGCLAYSNTLYVPFILDDFQVIGYNRTLDSVATFFASISWFDFSYKSRWFALATFAANNSIGGNSVVGFHIINLLIHLATGITIYYLAQTVISVFNPALIRRYVAAPLLASLAFLLHPVHTQAVTYIVQRMTSLATLLYLVTLLLYAKTFSPCNQLRRCRYLLYTLAFLSCLLAMSTKEISFTLPVALVIFDLCFLTGSHQQRIIRVLPFILCLLLMPVYLVGMDAGMDVINRGGGITGTTPLPRMAYLYTECRVLVTYLRLLILPVGQNLDYDYPVYTSLFETPVAASLAFLILLLVLAVYLVRASYNTAGNSAVVQRICGFSIIWFFVGHTIESAVVPLLDVIFEHRLYLPSVWFFIAGAIAGCELYHRLSAVKPYLIAGSAVLLVLAGSMTYRRNAIWHDRLSLWNDVVKKTPENVRGLTNLGRLLRTTDPAGAITLLERAVARNPSYFPAHNELAIALSIHGESQSALRHYLETIRLAPGFAKGWKDAGLFFLQERNYLNAQKFLQKAFELDPAGFTSHKELRESLRGY